MLLLLLLSSVLGFPLYDDTANGRAATHQLYSFVIEVCFGSNGFDSLPSSGIVPNPLFNMFLCWSPGTGVVRSPTLTMSVLSAVPEAVSSHNERRSRSAVQLDPGQRLTKLNIKVLPLLDHNSYASGPSGSHFADLKVTISIGFVAI